MPNDPTRIEIITGRERRRRYGVEQSSPWLRKPCNLA